MEDCSRFDREKLNGDKPYFSATKLMPTQISDTEVDLSNTEKADKTIERMLSSYDIGSKLRRLRLRKKMALVELGKHTGISASMLSQLENGKLTPTLPTLSRIALVFDVGLEYFFDYKRTKRTFSLMRGAERLRFPERPDTPQPSFFFEVLASNAFEKRFSAYLAYFPVRGRSEVRDHVHDGWELVHVLSGSVAIYYEAEEYVLEAGDSVYFDGLEPHSYRGRSEPPACALIITTQPQV
jgi:transcriptional regulator with XRE-family HTH domain